MDIKSKQTAQQRADQILSFQAELEIIENEQILLLDAAKRIAVDSYHQKLLTKLSSSFDVDTNKQEKQLSLGMKIASFLAALGLAASIFFLFFQFWGGFSTTLQVIILIATPFVLLSLTIYLNTLELTSYYVKIAALLSLTSFVLNLAMLGQIFNITPSPNALFIWAAFAVLLAYATDTRLLLGVGIISFSIFASLCSICLNFSE